MLLVIGGDSDTFAQGCFHFSPCQTIILFFRTCACVVLETEIRLVFFHEVIFLVRWDDTLFVYLDIVFVICYAV